MKQLMAASRTPLVITTSLAGVVAEMTYARNHHWLKLKDREGREIVMVENAVMRYACTVCDFIMTTEKNIGAGRPCPSCLKPMNGVWMRPQIALIPEQESDFEMPPKHTDDKDQDDGPPSVQ